MLKWFNIENKNLWMVSMNIDKAAVTKDMPILNAILKYADTDPVAFHMPGHKLGKGFDIDEFKAIGKFDLTEIPGTDNLHFPEEAIMEAQNLAARAFGADRTFFLVNGSTCGVHAAIMGTLSEGDKLIVSRDCHKSVIGGLMLARAVPVYVKPKMDHEFKIPLGCDVDAMIAAMDENPDAAGVFITRPTYYGVCCDVERLVDEAHKRGMAVIVDEAHGAHFRFHGELPVSAMDAGVDICIQSTHKTLPALTQTALLHVKGNLADPERIAFYLRLLETSSPSYIFLCAIDYARSLMEHSGQSLLEDIKNYVYEFEEELKENEYYRVRESLPADKKMLVPVAVSARHIHLSRQHLDVLFGEGYELKKKKELMGGQYAAEECVTILGSKMNSIENVRVLGPLRPRTQVEISMTDAVKLGLKPPVRESGKIEGSSPVTVVGPKGALYLNEGCIIAKRHIHLSLDDAARFSLKDNSQVSVRIPGERGGIFENVQVRVDRTYTLEMHIDTDEANAMGIKSGSGLEIVM
jgi:propanediol utilization protein